MPQPLPKHIKEFQVKVGNAVNERPELCLYAAKVIADWAQLEGTMSMLFVSLIHGDPGPTVAVYNAIRNNRAQKDAFEALADIRLVDEEEQDILGAILYNYNSARKNRNAIAHSLWGTLDELPKALILCDPSIAPKVQAKIRSRRVTNTFHMDDSVEMISQLREASTMWVLGDFIDADKRIKRTTILASTFMIMLPTVDRPEKNQDARKMLLSAPEIMDYMATRRGTSRTKA